MTVTVGLCWEALWNENENFNLAQKAYYISTELSDGDNKAAGLVRLGRLANKNGFFKQADSYFKNSKKYWDVLEHCVFYIVYYGDNFFKWGDFKNALVYFKKAYDISLKYPPSHQLNSCNESLLNLGLVYKATGDYDTAKKAFEESLKHDPDYVLAINEIKKMEALEEALDIANKIKIDHYIEYQLDELYQALHRTAIDDWNEIIVYETLREYLKKRPKNGLAWLWYGRALRDIGYSKESFKAFDEGLNVCGKEERNLIYFEIGRACEFYRTREEAENWYSKCFANGKIEVGWRWETRGKNLSVLCRFNEARKCFEKAFYCTDSSVEDDNLSYLSGLTFRAEENFIDAREAFQEAVDDNPKNKMAQSALDGLADIETTMEEVAAVRV